MKVANTDVGNDSIYMNSFVKKCSAQTQKGDDGVFTPAEDIDCEFIRSEAIMDKILKKRKKYERCRRVAEQLEKIDPYDNGLGGLFDLKPGEYAAGPIFENNQWILNKAGFYGDIYDFKSNGETAMEFFEDAFCPDYLYLLDEPENSMSPKYQRQLAELIVTYARFLKCQFIIATHSPFLLAMETAKIINLDDSPSVECNWTDLPNVREYFDFFMSKQKLFKNLKIL